MKQFPFTNKSENQTNRSLVRSFHEPTWYIKRTPSSFTKSHDSWKGRTENIQYFKWQLLDCATEKLTIATEHSNVVLSAHHTELS